MQDLTPAFFTLAAAGITAPHQTYTGECLHPPNTCREHQGRLSASVPPLARHMGRINAPPKTQQKFMMQLIDTVLAQQGR